MGRQRMTSLRIAPDYISRLKKDEVFVFGSNQKGHHTGGAAKTANEKFGARWGVGEGPSGNSYAIPSTFKSLDDIRPYVDRFLQHARKNPQKKFLVTRIGCGIAGFYDGEMCALFKEALKLPNVFLPRKWVEILLQDKTLFRQIFGNTLDDYDYYYLNAVAEEDLIKLSEKYMTHIAKGDKADLPAIRIRYVKDEGEFGFVDFGDCFMLDSNEFYIFSDSKIGGELLRNDYKLNSFFKEENQRTEPVRRVIFAGVETHYTDSYGDKIFTGDVLTLPDRNWHVALGPFGFNSENTFARYAFVLDNHCLFPEDCRKMTRVGTVFFDLDIYTSRNVSSLSSCFNTTSTFVMSDEERLILAMHTPTFNAESRLVLSRLNKSCDDSEDKNDTETKPKTGEMHKIGRIKSWYIDPDDPNGRRVMYTTHNYLLVAIVDGYKFYAARHDSKESEDDDMAIEIGDFELNGMEFNARFDDIKGNINYTNVSLK